MNNARSRALWLAALIGFTQSGLADESLMRIPWPPTWEFQQTIRLASAYTELRGRERAGNRVFNELSMLVIDIGAAPEPVTNAAIEELAQRLRARFTTRGDVGAVQPFANARGYYFVVTDRSSEEDSKYTHLIEGVMLDSGYLIEFVLQTNDAHSPATLTMLDALERFEIR